MIKTIDGFRQLLACIPCCVTMRAMRDNACHDPFCWTEVIGFHGTQCLCPARYDAEADCDRLRGQMECLLEAGNNWKQFQR